MNIQHRPCGNPQLTLKEPRGWFAAGAWFRLALTLVSDGAFKLFALICVDANRKTGRFEATPKELAEAVGKSKRIIGRYVADHRSDERTDQLAASGPDHRDNRSKHAAMAETIEREG